MVQITVQHHRGIVRDHRVHDGGGVPVSNRHQHFRALAAYPHTQGMRNDPTETLPRKFGGVAFFLSMIGVPINGLIVLISLTDKNMDAGKAFAWTAAHLGVLFFTIFLFQDGVFQDMFC